MTLSLRRGAAFLVGFGFSLLPAIAPLLALLYFTSHRLALRRSDLGWAGAAVLLAAPLLLLGAPGDALGVLLQIAAAWLVYRTFARLGGADLPQLNPLVVSAGLLTGLALVVALSAFEIGRLDLASAKTIAQAIVWESPPALYGHTVLTLGVLIAVLVGGGALRLASLGVAAAGILLSGSREAALAWVIAAVALLLVGGGRRTRDRVAEVLLIGLMIAVATGLAPLLGWGRIGFNTATVPRADNPNLLEGTEIANGDWWDSSRVQVESAEREVGDATLMTYGVTKLGSAGWLRLQQSVVVDAGEPYTVSVWIHPEDGLWPGVQGWGQSGDGGSVSTFTLTGALIDGYWRASASGPGRVTDYGVLQTEGSWRRVYATFVYDGTTPNLTLFLGLAPDGQDTPGTSARFAGFQLERGEAASAYTPGAATEGLDFGIARVPYWQAAWQGVAEKPLLGWGAGSFPAYFAERWPNRTRLHEVPSHTHNLLLQVMFERGLVGLAGLTLFLMALCWRAIRNSDPTFLTAVGAILLANIFDYTLFYGGVLYPLAAVAGWRATVVRGRVRGDAQGRRAGANLTLAASDYLAALFALVGAIAATRLFGVEGGATTLPPAVYYALLLWPLAAWREGLYPGYGLTPPQELRRQVSGAVFAGLILVAGTLLFAHLLPLPPATVLLTVALGAVLLPIGRGLSKRLLLALDMWGRPVVVLGAGETGRRVVRSLRRNRLAGLLPIALFDDDPDLRSRRVGGVRVMGTLTDADDFARRHAVHHAIVAIPSLPSEMLAGLIDRKGRTFAHLQFVPRLVGLPAEDVFASNLDGMLALEVRKGLYAPANRFVKRVLDLLGSVAVALPLTPVMAALYLWVRLDSAGPAFHRSERVGQRGKRFYCLKFRTMYLDAETRLGELLDTDPALREEYLRFHKLERDPRVTRAGRVLRALSLDELPQLFNVLASEMSLVGPRPYLMRELADMDGYGDIIFEAKPGMTGHWQTSGRADTTFGDRLEMEAHYVRNWSIWWDIVILVRTLPAVFERRGAR